MTVDGTTAAMGLWSGIDVHSAAPSAPLLTSSALPGATQRRYCSSYRSASCGALYTAERQDTNTAVRVAGVAITCAHTSAVALWSSLSDPPQAAVGCRSVERSETYIRRRTRHRQRVRRKLRGCRVRAHKLTRRCRDPLAQAGARSADRPWRRLGRLVGAMRRDERLVQLDVVKQDRRDA